jgi:hypothetical protein
MLQDRKRFSRIVLSAVIGALLVAAPVLAAPGDPLAGDDTGCAPSTKIGLNCAKKVLSLVTKLRLSVVKCHLTQAGHAFKNGSGTPGFSNAEDNCEDGPSNTSAKAKFDAKISSLLTKGCDATVLGNAATTRDVILGDRSIVGSIDNLNGTFFCDPTSGNEIDPGGDDAGFVPANAGNYKCSVGVAKAWSKLDKSLYTCHAKLAKAVFKGVVFDDESCEDLGPKSALAKYDAKVNKLIAAGICPPCLTDPGPTNALDLGPSAIADADASLQDVYICPGP